MANQFAEAHFHDETAARQWFEAARWPNGPVCPKCRSAKHYATKKVGVYRCAAPTCRKDFTVMTGTVMERSHAKLTQWAAPSRWLQRARKAFGRTSSTASWGASTTPLGSCFIASREAMRRGGLDVPPLGGEGGIVEIDETYIGKQDNPQPSKQRSGRRISARAAKALLASAWCFPSLNAAAGCVHSIRLAPMAIRSMRSSVRTLRARRGS